MKIALGSKVKDRVSGLVGIAIGRSEWLYGCVRLTIQPQELKDGKPVDTYGIDEDAAIVIEDPTPEITGKMPGLVELKSAVEIPAAVTGGPREDARRAPDARR